MDVSLSVGDVETIIEYHRSVPIALLYQIRIRHELVVHSGNRRLAITVRATAPTGATIAATIHSNNAVFDDHDQILHYS